MRTTHEPCVPSVVDVCEVCGCRVWRSARSLGYEGRVVCHVCGMLELAELGGAADIRPAPWVAADLER
jgi:hypothetical protein